MSTKPRAKQITQSPAVRASAQRANTSSSQSKAVRAPKVDKPVKTDKAQAAPRQTRVTKTTKLTKALKPAKSKKASAGQLSASPSFDDPATRRAQFDAARELALQDFRSRRDPDQLCKQLCGLTDELLYRVWVDAHLPSSWALLAVGGYGRGDLFPHSDIDLLILVDAEPEGQAIEFLEQFVGQCWDLGLELSQSVRSIAQCIEEQAGDITIQTAMLERRFLTGSLDLAGELESALHKVHDPVTFVAGKTVEMRQRHARYQDTPFSLEPNTKESPGGLRDLQLIAWIARASGFGKSWQQLRRNGLLTSAELQMISHNERLIKRIRAALHVIARRHEDRLVFDVQGLVADLLGYRDRPDRRASEQLMQRYYRAAKTVTQLTTILLQNIDSHLSDTDTREATEIDGEFQVRNGLLEPIDDELFTKQPAAILRAFLWLQKDQSLRGMSTPTLRAIWNARTRIDASFRKNPENRALFMSILQQPQGITRAMRGLNQWSILGHYLPVFRNIVGRMQHDLFHVYTVDQHILTVLRNVRRFAISEHAHEYPFCSQLMTTVEKPHLLYIAALFHDIAKGRGGDHSVLGMADARRFCRQHEIDAEDTTLICFLVEHHLTMSTVAQKQDLGDPAVIHRFGKLVGSEERLVALYLLTVADIRGTSPKVWNGWKAKLLEDLFRHTRANLGGDNPSTEERIGARRKEAIRLLTVSAINPSQFRQFWSTLGIPYFLRTEASDIAWHARVFGPNVDTTEPLVRSRVAAFGEGFQVAVYLPNQEDLFGRLCGFFDASGLSVLDARVHTTASNYALDSFLVVDPRASDSYRDRLPLLESQLQGRLAERAPLGRPLEARSSRRSRSFPIKPKIEFRPYENGSAYLLSIVANDRPGLLYRIALVMAKHGISVYTARISTLGERAEDTFIVEGQSLANPNQQLRIETELHEALVVPKKLAQYAGAA